MDQSAEERIRRVAENVQTRSGVARLETLEIRGQMVVEDRVRRGKQSVVIGWVNALKTRLDGHSWIHDSQLISLMDGSR